MATWDVNAPIDDANGPGVAGQLRDDKAALSHSTGLAADHDFPAAGSTLVTDNHGKHKDVSLSSGDLDVHSAISGSTLISNDTAITNDIEIILPDSDNNPQPDSDYFIVGSVHQFKAMGPSLGQPQYDTWVGGDYAEVAKGSDGKLLYNTNPLDMTHFDANELEDGDLTAGTGALWEGFDYGSSYFAGIEIDLGNPTGDDFSDDSTYPDSSWGDFRQDWGYLNAVYFHTAPVAEEGYPPWVGPGQAAVLWSNDGEGWYYLIGTTSLPTNWELNGEVVTDVLTKNSFFLCNNEAGWKGWEWNNPRPASGTAVSRRIAPGRHRYWRIVFSYHWREGLDKHEGGKSNVTQLLWRQQLQTVMPSQIHISDKSLTSFKVHFDPSIPKDNGPNLTSLGGAIAPSPSKRVGFYFDWMLVRGSA